MTISIKIENLKSIDSMDFEVPAPGTYLITGANGCGKTSLLTVLHRMGVSNAFQLGFPGGKVKSGIDGLQNTLITYNIHGKEVEYKYNQSRWSASPKSFSKLISSAYSEVLFLKANSSRVEPTQEELRGVRKYLAPLELRNFLNLVFDTNKFDKLHQVNLRGRGLTAYIIEKPNSTSSRKSWYSEKMFSLGELCVMRLALKLLSMKNGGLYIIDEFEMALHPAAQIRLFEKIKNLTDDISCTVLVSSHSSSLIKSVPKNSLIYLENINGIVSIHKNVYPAYALQHLTLSDDASTDKVFFVEDVSAKYCVEELRKQFIANNSTIGSQSLPAVQVVIVGGYKEVLRFLDRCNSFMPKHINKYALLDADSQPLCVPTAVTSSLTVVQQLYSRLAGSVDFLPWTPEIGFCDLLLSDLQKHKRGIESFTGSNNLQIPLSLANSHFGLSGKLLGNACKTTVDNIAQQISTKMSWTVERAKESLMGYLVKEWFLTQTPAVKALTGKLFK